MNRIALTLALLVTVLAMSLLAGAASSYAVVVHRSNPTSNIRLVDLRAFFSGETKQWPNGMKLVLVARDLESTVFRFLMQHVLGTTAVEYQRHLMNIEFIGETPVTLKVLNSDAAACKFVFNVPGAIAVIDASSLPTAECNAVKLLRIDAKLPDQEGYRLR